MNRLRHFPDFVLASFLTFGLAACGQVSDETVVTIDTGQIQGARVQDVLAFKGIPFAAPPVGDLRWRPPQRPEAWDGVRDAGSYGDFCPQIDSAVLWFDLGQTSEDCLTLNVWTQSPQPSAKRPVMVWIHGGGFVQGSGNIPRLNSPNLVKEDVVLVTLNYRLTVFGFMAHPALAAAAAGQPQGNYGLMDVVAALEWVQRNIESFGGDPDNITIFGESAGGALVNYLMIMPSADGLFHRAISQSASVGLNPDARIDRRSGFQISGEKAGLRFTERAGIDNDDQAAAKLRAMTTEQLVANLDFRERYTPVIDGETIPDHVGIIFAAGEQHDVPYMTGGNSWEASLGRQIGGGFSPEFSAKLITQQDKLRLYPGMEQTQLEDQIFGDLIILSQARYLADQMENVSSETFHYYLTYVADARRASQPGAAHTDDIAFVLQTLDSEPLDRVTEQDREISRLMSSYWVQFARTGNPNRDGLPLWPAYDSESQAVIEIGDQPLVQNDPLSDRIAFHMQRGIALLEKNR